MVSVLFRAENPILHHEEAHVEERPRVGARPQIATNTHAALAKYVRAHGEVGGSTKRLIVSLRKPEPLLAGTTESRRQKTRGAIVVFQRHRRIRQIDDRHVLDTKSRRTDARPIARVDPRLLRMKTPLRF